MLRSMDRTAFPEGPAFSQRLLRGRQGLQGPLHRGVTPTSTRSRSRATTSRSRWTPRSRTCPTGAPSRRWARSPRAASPTPAKYAQQPLATGPYKFDEYNPERSLTLVRNEEWDPATDPAARPTRTPTSSTSRPPARRSTRSCSTTPVTARPRSPTTTCWPRTTAIFQSTSTRTGWSRAAHRAPTTGAGLPQDRVPTRCREALAWAYPYKDATVAAGYIVDVTRIIDGDQPDAPGHPRSRGVQPDPRARARHDRPREGGRQILEEAGEIGFELRFLFANDDPNAVTAKDVIVEAFEEAGFTTKPVATTLAELLDAARRPRRQHQHAHRGLVLGLAVGRLVVPAGAQLDQPRRRGPGLQLRGVQRAGHRRSGSTTSSARRSRTSRRRGTSWTSRSPRSTSR